MARNFEELRAKMDPERRARNFARAQQILLEMSLKELREALNVSQEDLAARQNIRQANVSKLEKRTNAYISTLKSTIEALGGQLDIIARFPDGDVKLTNFSSESECSEPIATNE
jgi:transcriptional regulator with XRE-family HTH domain